MQKLIGKYRAWRLRQACRNIRREMLRWGFDLRNVTDDEMIARATLTGEMIARLGVSDEDAGKALAQTARETQYPFNIPDRFR